MDQPGKKSGVSTIRLREPLRSIKEGLMEEQQLIYRVRGGDPKAIDDIFEAYKGHLFAFIMRMTGNVSIAEDIFQETWLRVIRNVHSFRGDSKFSTWLFTIALNLCRDRERKKRDIFCEPIENHVNSLSCGPDVDPIRIITAMQVRKLVNELPLKMREVIILRYYHDMSDQEIARIVDCPEGTVKSRCHRASEILRKKWERSEMKAPDK